MLSELKSSPLSIGTKITSLWDSLKAQLVADARRDLQDKHVKEFISDEVGQLRGRHPSLDEQEITKAVSLGTGRCSAVLAALKLADPAALGQAVTLMGAHPNLKNVGRINLTGCALPNLTKLPWQKFMHLSKIVVDYVPDIPLDETPLKDAFGDTITLQVVMQSQDLVAFSKHPLFQYPQLELILLDKKLSFLPPKITNNENIRAIMLPEGSRTAEAIGRRYGERANAIVYADALSSHYVSNVEEDLRHGQLDRIDLIAWRQQLAKISRPQSFSNLTPIVRSIEQSRGNWRDKRGRANSFESFRKAPTSRWGRGRRASLGRNQKDKQANWRKPMP